MFLIDSSLGAVSAEEVVLFRMENDDIANKSFAC
jgi:hypothetical protein